MSGLPENQPAPVSEADLAASGATAAEKQAEINNNSGSENDESDADAETHESTTNTDGAKKKKKRKNKKKKTTAGSSTGDAAPFLDAASVKAALEQLPPQQLEELMKLNPALVEEIKSGSTDGVNLAQMLRHLTLNDIMTGLASSGRNVKDMGSYKFWQTQPVPRLDEKTGPVEEGPLKPNQKVEDVPKEPAKLLDSFEWVEVDFTKEEELKEVHALLQGHYVEDTDSTLRFNYSLGMLRWAMMSPGWKKMWHVGVRAKPAGKLVAFISAIPVKVNVHGKQLLTSEVNFLVVHKKLRGKRLAPLLIKEITRRSNLEGIWQGLYTGGNVLPRPISTCRYYHRALNWTKLYEVGFSPLPFGQKPSQMVRKYALPDSTATPGLRPMKLADVDAVLGLFRKYLKRYELVPVYTREEFLHWFPMESPEGEEQFFWTYVVENDKKQITDFFSFYCLESSVINNPKHKAIRAAYLSYYATDVALTTPVDKDTLSKRLNLLMNDALILAKKHNFDVFNALSLMDNGLFLSQQKYGPGDGQLHYYLFNYLANPISGGVDKNNILDTENLSGIGLVML
ncbi:glycylpeptide N-tetradecanoyltransferase [Ceratocystis pirilliformis]|uniref:Glycylpeptide N-tetradecanoyltransferase n=1 Tax=Ceratocystis pirilliformis TaxID=259994 RepID=A0ABR3ZJR7_9PEZI